MRKNMLYLTGYDGIPVEELQGMGINSHPGSTYGPVQDMDMGAQFEDMPPAPPQDNNQVRFQKHVIFSVPINWPISGCRLVWHRPLGRILGTMSWWPVTPLSILRSNGNKHQRHFKLVDTVLLFIHLSWIFLRFCKCVQSEFFIAWKIQCLSQKWKI